MFHQANLINTTWASSTTDPLYVSPRPTNNASLLEYWYVRVLAELSKYVNTGIFPVQVRSIVHDARSHTFFPELVTVMYRLHTFSPLMRRFVCFRVGYLL